MPSNCNLHRPYTPYCIRCALGRYPPHSSIGHASTYSAVYTGPQPLTKLQSPMTCQLQCAVRKLGDFCPEYKSKHPWSTQPGA
eukprot:652348-Prymnesium_polylepis.1